MKKTISILFLAGLSVSSCMKKPDHTPDYGPEIPFTDIQKAANFDMPVEPSTIKKGQRVSLDFFQVVDTQQPMTLMQRSDEVTFQSEEKDANTQETVSYHWTFNVILREMDETGHWKISQSPYGPLCYAVTEQGCTAMSAQAQEDTKGSLRPYTLQGVRTKDLEEPYKVTYHNLKREDGFLPVPQVVANRPDCGGVKNCSQGLRYVRISFDRVIWESEAKGTKTNFRFTYSSDIPTYVYDWIPGDVFPTNQVDSCIQTWIEITNANNQTQVVPVRKCMEITDFQFGT